MSVRKEDDEEEDEKREDGMGRIKGKGRRTRGMGTIHQFIYPEKEGRKKTKHKSKLEQKLPPTNQSNKHYTELQRKP